MLEISYKKECLEAGCDEAGRGCLAGPVFAAAVILPPDYFHPLLNDSKQMTARERLEVRDHIIANATAWAIAEVSAEEIDRINILKASFEAMQRAVEKLPIRPDHLLIDGNRFYPRLNIPYRCEVKGDARFANIAAASVLAKTFRDEYVEHIVDKKCRAKQCTALRKYVIDPNKCIGCSKCAKNCPVNAISGKIKTPFTIDSSVCIKCNACRENCAFGAVYVEA